MQICHLCFMCLTLPICVGIECQNIKQELKTTKMSKDHLAMASQMASNSKEFQVPSPQRWPWRSNGELNGEQFRKVGKTRQERFTMARNIPARRNNAVSSYPYDVAETHWQRKLKSPWRDKIRQAKLYFFSICIKAHFPQLRHYLITF